MWSGTVRGRRALRPVRVERGGRGRRAAAVPEVRAGSRRGGGSLSGLRPSRDARPLRSPSGARSARPVRDLRPRHVRRMLRRRPAALPLSGAPGDRGDRGLGTGLQQRGRGRGPAHT